MKSKNNNERYTVDKIEALRKKADRKWTNYYKRIDGWLYQALEKYSIKDKAVVVMGSASPWYEAVCLSNGCTDVSVIEYNKINCNHPNITYYTPGEYDANPIQFNIGIVFATRLW